VKKLRTLWKKEKKKLEIRIEQGAFLMEYFHLEN
jgi:hypothetical protein